MIHEANYLKPGNDANPAQTLRIEHQQLPDTILITALAASAKWTEKPAATSRDELFAHLKATVHAVLFLFKPSGSGVLDFSLQQVLVWNRALTTEAGARPLNDHLCAAITPLK